MGFFDSNKTTTNSTTQNYDQRQVITNTTDSRNYDLSNRSTNIDSSTTNVTTLDGGAIAGIVGVAERALVGAKDQALGAYGLADGLFSAATLYANKVNQQSADAFSQAASLTNDAIVQARGAFTDANRSVADAYAGAQGSMLGAFREAQVAMSGAQAATAAAYADAKGTTNAQKQIIIGVLVVAGIMALSVMQRKAA